MKAKKLILSVLSASLVYQMPLISDLSFGTNVASAQAEQAAPARKTKKIPTMRNKVYTQFARAQKIADEGDIPKGIQVLDEVQERISSMNDYEIATMWNFYGFLHYANEDLDKTIEYFSKVVEIEAIPNNLYLSTLYSLGQLAMQQGKYDKAIEYLTQWREKNPKRMLASQYALFAQVYYQDKQYQKTIDNIVLARENNFVADVLQPPKENWLILQRAAYYSLKQPEKVTEVIEELVRYYDKPEYWIQLGGMYGEIGQEKKQLGIMEAAWQAGYLKKSSELVMLSQLYLYHELPYKAAKVLDDAIAQGIVVADVKRLELMAQSYVMAKEDEKAIPVLIKAAKIAENGKYDAQLAQAYLNLEKWDLAIASAETALERGELANEGNMYLVLGMSNFNLKNFDQALTAFTKAQDLPKVAKTAKQWHAYVSKEKNYQEQVALLSAGN